MIQLSHVTKTVLTAASGVVLVIGLISSPVFAQQALSADELKAHIEKQQAALDAAIANRDRTQAALESKRKAFEEQTAKQEAVEAKMKELCEQQEELKPGTLENCLAAINTK